jgi:hypothetical protein
VAITKLGEQVAITKLREQVAITKLGERVVGNTRKAVEESGKPLKKPVSR